MHAAWPSTDLGELIVDAQEIDIEGGDGGGVARDLHICWCFDNMTGRATDNIC